MYDPINPYASPTAPLDPVAVQWLGTPSPSLRRVANGLGLIFTANLITLAEVLGGIAFLLLVRVDPATLETFSALTSAASLAALVLGIVGCLFCLATPAESGARGLIYTSVGATLLALLIHFAVWLRAMPPATGTLESILNVVAIITFLLFLSSLAKFIGRWDLSKRAVSILIWGILATVAFIVGMVMFVATVGLAVLEALATHQPWAQAQFQAAIQRAGGNTVMAGLLIFTSILVMFVVYIIYLILLFRSRTAILSGGRG